MRDINWLIAEKNIAEPEKLSKFRCPNYGLTSLNGIEKFTALEYLNCSSNRLKSLKGIESLEKLRILIANDNILKDIITLENTNIVHLELVNNKLESTEIIIKMPKAEIVNIAGNGFDVKITNILDGSYRSVEKFKEFIKQNPIYASSKIGKLMKTGIFERIMSFEDFKK
jgi:Leucine-rich repeat (LRR) protein